MTTPEVKTTILIDEELLKPLSCHEEKWLSSLSVIVIPYTPGAAPEVRSEGGSFIISDRPDVIERLTTNGFVGLFVLTQRGFAHLDKVPGSWFVFHHVEDAINWIMDHPRGVEDFMQTLRVGAEFIKKGGLVAFPTETVYGLGACAFNAEAVTRIFEAKGRPLDDPLIVHVANKEQVERLSTNVSPLTRMLMDRFWPGPLTLVVPKSPSVPDIVTAGLPTVAIRLPANPWTRKFISLARTPIAAPSANAFGRTSPTSARHVIEQLTGRYDFLIDGGACRVGVESTVLSLVHPKPTILRPGGVTKEEIEALIGPVEATPWQVESKGAKPSPGLLTTHYAPRTPMIVSSDLRAYTKRRDVGLITLRKPHESVSGPVISLSPRGDLREAAINLYRAMRELDQMNLALIVAEEMPQEGLGMAINDRLKRASRKI